MLLKVLTGVEILRFALVGVMMRASVVFVVEMLKRIQISIEMMHVLLALEVVRNELSGVEMLMKKLISD